MAGQHRLALDFANHDGIRFMCDNGDLRDTTDHRLVASTGRHINTGDTWSPEDIADESLQEACQEIAELLQPDPWGQAK